MRLLDPTQVYLLDILVSALQDLDVEITDQQYLVISQHIALMEQDLKQLKSTST